MLEHHTELGAGYRIALKDLELRGAGNLLGAEQSGHAQAVGFDLYMRWLEETVRALRGQGTVEQPAPPEVVLDRPAHLPDGYVPDDDVKLDLYRRLARAAESGEIDGLRDELRERFGPLPEKPRRCWTWPAFGSWGRLWDFRMCWCGETRPGSPSDPEPRPGSPG